MFGSILKAVRKHSIRRTVGRLRTMPLGRIMTRHVITIRSDESVVQAATKMVAEAISCLVVVDGGKLTGIISERDFLLKVPLDKRALHMKVRDIMTPNVTTVTPSITLPEAIDLMRSKGFRRLVVCEGDRILGIVTQTDFSRTIAESFKAYPIAPEFTIGAIMSKKVLTTTQKDTFTKACARMKKLNVGCIIITGGKPPAPLGIFTESDVVMQFYDHQGRIEIKDISEFMHKYVRAGATEMSVFEANRLMLEKNMRRLLVVEGDKIVGVLTQTDIVRFVYPAFDRILVEADKRDVPLRSFSRHTEFAGEFRGEHLKVYRL